MMPSIYPTMLSRHPINPTTRTVLVREQISYRHDKHRDRVTQKMVPSSSRLAINREDFHQADVEVESFDAHPAERDQVEVVQAHGGDPAPQTGLSSSFNPQQQNRIGEDQIGAQIDVDLGPDHAGDSR